MTPFDTFELPTADGTAHTSWLVAPLSSLGGGIIDAFFNTEREQICQMLGAGPDEISVVIWEDRYPFAISQDTGLSLRLGDDAAPMYCSLPMIQGLRA